MRDKFDFYEIFDNFPKLSEKLKNSKNSKKKLCDTKNLDSNI